MCATLSLSGAWRSKRPSTGSRGGRREAPRNRVRAAVGSGAAADRNREDRPAMHRAVQAWVVAGGVLAGMLVAGLAAAEEPKHGGILRMYHRDSPASASLH